MTAPVPVEEAQRWADTVAGGGAVVIAQRRLPAAFMFAGSAALLALVVFLSGWGAGSGYFGVHVRLPYLLPVCVVAGLGIVVTGHRLVTAGPRLRIDADGVRYGRFRADWADVGQVRVANVQNVEVRGKAGRHPLDNRVTAALMRRLVGARGSWLSAWLNADTLELAHWLEAERARRRTRP